MKNGMIFIMACFLVFGTNPAGMAQEKERKVAKEEVAQREKAEKARKEEQELEMEKRKQFLEQEMQHAMKDHEADMREFEVHMEDFEVMFEDGVIRIPERPDRNFVVMSDEWMPFGQNSQTQLTLRNSFRGGSDSSSGTFEVDEGTKRFRCMISGKVRSGEIKISIKYPGGKIFKDMTINSSAEVTFSQSVNIGEADPDKYIGSWEYSVEAVKAEGNYMLQISTN